MFLTVGAYLFTPLGVRHLTKQHGSFIKLLDANVALENPQVDQGGFQNALRSSRAA